MSTAAAGADSGVATAHEDAERRMWRPLPTFASYVATGGLYGIWWFFVARREMARELGREPSAAIALVEGIAQLIPVVNAFIWRRALNDINTLREKVGAPAVHVTGWYLALLLSIPCIYLLPDALAPALDLFNPDATEIVRAVGYALLPAQLLVFGWAMGYYNEYWLEKTGERATYRKLGPFEWIGMLLAVALIVAALAAFLGEI